MKSNIQEQLKARKLKPSENSWEVLDARLEQDRKGSNKKVLWYAVASVAAVLLISLGVFRSTTSDAVIPKQQSVEIQEDTDAPTYNPIQNNSENKEELIAMPVEKVEKPTEEKSYHLQKNESIAQNVTFDRVEVNPKISENNLAIQLPIEEPVLVVKEGVADIDKTNVSDSELESLLQDAKIAVDMRKQRDQRKSDADWLLVEVEMELDHNFKDRVFDAIKNAVSNPKNTITKRDN